MFKIYISKIVDGELPSEEPSASCECEDLQVAAQMCIDLRKMDYSIHEVVLPNGESVNGFAIDLTILAGINTSHENG